METVILHNIFHWTMGGKKEFVATTNNLDQWLIENNKDREEPEKLEDFEIEEVSVWWYKGVSDA